MSNVVLTAGQERALTEIIEARKGHRRHLLTGFAGSGKTTLMQCVAAEFKRERREVVMTAPTHKAVSVLSRKLREAGLDDVPCLTTHSLLSLQPTPDGAKVKLKRRTDPKPVTADVVIVDEASMVSEDLLHHLDRHAGHCFVLYVGDPAQLPPVGERASASFATRSRSHLDTIVRQAQGNPVLAAAHAIRESQTRDAFDWSWCRPAKAPPLGVYVPHDPDAWLRHAFTSDAFRADNDRFRYLCWTNARVAWVNAKVRRWLYGETSTPFVAGERVLLRQPVLRDDAQVFATNEEAEVSEISKDTFAWEFKERERVLGWTVSLPSWRVVLLAPDGREVPVHMARNQEDVDIIDAKLIAEAERDHDRWGDRFGFLQALAKLQAVYAMTVHVSQGSTFSTAFLDVSDISRRARSNALEAKQLLYVAATRPSESLVLVNAAERAA